jgi:hypothetical protein
MRIYTYEIVKQYFTEQNCELLSTDYKNTENKLKYICSCGNIWETSFGKFMVGQRCKTCRYEKMKNKRKQNYDDVYNYFKDQGCELISTEFINSRTNLEYKCKCGTISSMTFDNFKNKNKRCKKCAGCETHTYDYIKEYIESFDYELLDTTYQNNRQNLNIKCPEGHIYQAAFSTFQRGSRCLQCFKSNNFAENHHNWKNDRTRQVRANYLAFNIRNVSCLQQDENYNNYLMNSDLYAVDHIFPRIAFVENNLDNLYEPKIVKAICNSLDNLRIILRKENSDKRAKYDTEKFMDWFNEKYQQLHNS